MSIVVQVTDADIREGVAGSCEGCPVALAVLRATGRSQCMVFTHDYELRIEVDYFSIPAPWEVRQFVSEFDRFRDNDDEPLPSPLPEELAPFSFELTDLDDPEWLDKCYDCEEFYPTAELDREGYCKECLAKRQEQSHA